MGKIIALRNCKFVKELTENTDIAKGDLLFKNGRIAQIAACGTKFDGVTEEFDAMGMTALPGLIDAHVHLAMTHDLQAESFFVDPCTRVFECLQYAQYLMSIGITTVRDCGDDRNYPTISLRNAINSGLVKGPHVLCSGLTLSPTEPGTDEFGNMTYAVDGAEEMRHAVRVNYSHGVDFIKLYGSGSMMGKGSTPGIGIMEEDEILEAVKITKSKGGYCAIHCHGTDAIDLAVRCGVGTVEHASFIGAETLKRLAGRTDCGIIPTLAVTYDIMEHTDPKTDYGKFVIAKVKALLDKIKESLRAAYEKRDVLIGWGTDCPMSTYVREPGVEFRIRHDILGYGNLDLLKQATINSAKLLRMDDEIGSIAVGKCADVILVDGDPVQNIKVMYGGAKHVFKAGEQYK